MREVKKKFIDVRNPNHTIQKAIRGPYSDETPEEVEARLLAQAKNTKSKFADPNKYPISDKNTGLPEDDKCPICEGSGWRRIITQLDPRGPAGDRCWGCGGSGKMEDFLKNRKNKNPYADIEDDDWRKHGEN
jgi:hypothetical protein